MALIAKSGKTLYRNFFYSLLLLGKAVFVSAQDECIPVHLQCEWLENPIGIDAAHPRLSWQLHDSRPGAKQTAWRLTVGTDSAAVSRGMGDMWRYGEPAGSAQLLEYEGRALQPFTRYFWAVQVGDMSGHISRLSPVASFETGMMDRANWQGSWISDGRPASEKAAPYFRKTFSLSKPVRSARAYIAVAGLYELYINGQKIGDHRLDPMYTRFDRRTLYLTHDVTTQLQNGGNAIGVLLGNGWYNHQSTAVWNFHEAPWRNRPAFCMDLHIEYADSTTEVISTGKDWKTSLSPIIFNSIYTGEHYDARLEQPGWNEAKFADKDWKTVVFRSAPAQNIVAQVMRPIRAVDTLMAKSVNKISDTVYVFDLGRNIAGVSSIKISGKAGTVIRLKHAERLSGGRADQSNISVHYRPTDDKDPFG
ncbi:MAG: family 78 glycoside hydrolase catalytic domain, partial [Bacteroidetes bacterium]|nr:family 78 glycoside hydrolase catalytic domain [Bacteroidota bacterium]